MTIELIFIFKYALYKLIIKLILTSGIIADFHILFIKVDFYNSCLIFLLIYSYKFMDELIYTYNDYFELFKSGENKYWSFLFKDTILFLLMVVDKKGKTLRT